MQIDAQELLEKPEGLEFAALHDGSVESAIPETEEFPRGLGVLGGIWRQGLLRDG